MHRIWFKQQKPFDYMPLKAGLGIVSERDLFNYTELENMVRRDEFPELCQKIYTTRTRKMSGEYVVVEGSWFKAVPVQPSITFKVAKTWQLDLKKERFLIDGTFSLTKYLHLELPDYTFPELDLGLKGATFQDLREELLKLNKNATIDTPFYISRLEPLQGVE